MNDKWIPKQEQEELMILFSEYGQENFSECLQKKFDAINNAEDPKSALDALVEAVYDLVKKQMFWLVNNPKVKIFGITSPKLQKKAIQDALLFYLNTTIRKEKAYSLSRVSDTISFNGANPINKLIFKEGSGHDGYEKTYKVLGNVTEKIKEAILNSSDDHTFSEFF